MAQGQKGCRVWMCMGARVFDPPLFPTSLLLAVTDHHPRRVIPPFLVFLLPPGSAIWGLYSRSARLNFTFGEGAHMKLLRHRHIGCRHCTTSSMYRRRSHQTPRSHCFWELRRSSRAHRMCTPSRPLLRTEAYSRLGW